MDRWWIVFLCIAWIIPGCSGESADELFAAGEAATHQEATYPQAMAHLKRFLERYPDDPRADLALQALARVLLNQGENEQAIARYEEIIRRFPTSRYADQALFMVGYIYDLDGRQEQARAAYQKVMDEHPNSDLVDDARISIANLGKPPEAWFPADSTTSQAR
jgi:TolA-binding protein